MKEKETKKENETPFINNISEIYQKINFYKKGFIAAVTCGVFQSITILCLIFSNPIVIHEKDGERLGYVGERKEIIITQREIKELVKKFIKRRYEWQVFKPELITRELSPFIKNGLSKKIKVNLLKEQKQLKGQNIKQYVGKIIVKIDKNNRIIGLFDKVMRIEGIPLLSEAQVLIGIVKGLVTKSNKLGLYINSVVNYEAK